jgi:hypothetical protein
MQCLVDFTVSDVRIRSDHSKCHQSKRLAQLENFLSEVCKQLGTLGVKKWKQAREQTVRGWKKQTAGDQTESARLNR